MAQGFISKIEARQTKFGAYYDVYIDGQKLGAGKFEPKGVAAGDYVTYEVDMNGQYQNLRPGSLSKSTPPAGVAAPKAAAPTAASGISMATQDVISRQAALNSALAFMTILQAGGALPEGKTLAAAKKADKLEAILLEYVQRFYQYNTGSTYEIPEAIADEAATDWTEE